MVRTAVIYVRISRDADRQGLGVARQEADCRELAARLGWTVAAVHTDNDISAYSGKARPGYRALLADLTGHRADAVIAWHPDRLHRRVAELEQFVTVCEANNVMVQTVRAGAVDLSTPSGRMVARMLGAAAQHEVDQTKARIVRAKAQAAADGKWRGGRRPFGYRDDGVTVHPVESRALADAAAGVLAGRSLVALARELNDAGLLTPAGLPWGSTALRRALLRPRNAGLVARHGTEVGPAVWPAIIPEQTWRAVVAVLTNPARTTTTGPERRWLGSGLYLCGACGATCRASIAGKRVRAYVCSARGTDRPVTGEHVARRVDQVDALVHAVIARRLGLPDVAGLLSEPAGVDMADLQMTAMQYRTRLDEAAVMFADGVMTGAQFKTMTARLRAELADAETAVASAMGGGALAALGSEPDPAAAYLAAPLDAQRAVVDALAVVTLLPAKRGRPAGWRPGDPYFSTDTVSIAWRQA
jgi:site-specific DNA recombinase